MESRLPLLQRLIASRSESARDSGRGLAADASQAWSVVERGLPLSDGTSLDLVLRDESGKAWPVLVDDSGRSEELLGRALKASAEITRLRGLLQLALDGEGPISFEESVLVLVSRRYSDSIHELSGRLQELRLLWIEWPEALDQEASSPSGLREPARSEPPREDSRSSLPDERDELPGREFFQRAANGISRPLRSSFSSVHEQQVHEQQVHEQQVDEQQVDEQPARERPVHEDDFEDELAELEGVPASEESEQVALALVDEAKSKLLRIGDEVQEEVDGNLTRFLVRGRVLAVLSKAQNGISLYVGDRPDRRRDILDAEELDRALDDVFRRYFHLTGRGHLSSRGRPAVQGHRADRGRGARERSTGRSNDSGGAANGVGAGGRG